MVSLQIKVLVVDDSAFMRNALGRMISDTPGMMVIGKARNGIEAIDLTRQKRPDLITLDIEMPEMDGLTALRLIRQFSDIPVLMISSLTSEGSVSSLKAMRYGASDVLAKDHSMVSANIHNLRDDLVMKINALANAKQDVPANLPQTHIEEPAGNNTHLPDLESFELIVVGASTGAPPHLELLAKSVPAGLNVPLVIAQHMPPVFTASLAQRLNTLSPLRCVEAEDGMRLEAGMIILAPGGQHTRIARQGDGMITRVSDRPEHLIYKPSVDELFSSAAEATGGQTLGIVLTGMGADGSVGGKDIHAAGGKLITQDAASCVVYGMPKAIDEAGLSHASMTPDQIAGYISGKVSV